MSKFDFGSFIGGYDDFAVNSEKYSYKEAVEIFKQEYACENDIIGTGAGEYSVSNAFVKWRVGVDEDHKPCACWWLEYEKRPKGSCPVYTFRKNMIQNDYIIFSTLWYTVKEMNHDDIENYYTITKTNINEEEQYGEAIIRNHLQNIDNKWYWDSDVDLWIRSK